ncbi:MAG: autotransporter-associated beta strand repeat-containing protein, partial [Candidatus Omnitrophota bacterium]
MRTHKKTSNHVKTLCLLLGFGAIFSFASVYADPFTVTNYDSSGAGSLSTAINGLNLSGVSGSITFNESSSSGTIDLTGYTTSLGFETVFDLNNYDVTLTNYVGGCTSWTDFAGATTGVLNIGSGSTWTNTWGVVIGKTTTGALTVSNGGDLAVSNGGIFIASEGADAVGALTVTGSGSTLANAADLNVGYSGDGTLTVSDGGVVTDTTDLYVAHDAGSTGIITVTGSGSTLSVRDMYIGDAGEATLTISAGGSVRGSSGFLGTDASSTSTVTVTGSGSSFTTTSDMYIGYSGDCTMNISAGGDVIAATGFIGSNSGSDSTATVTGDGSTLTTTGNLYVGMWDTGTLNVQSSGDVSSAIAFIGYGADATGTATVTGSGSAWANAGDLYVGYSGDGTLTVSDGGALTIGGGSGLISIGHEAGSSGILHIGNGAAAGTINAAEITGDDGTPTLDFNHNNEDYTFAPNLTGNLIVTHNGSGVSNLTGTNTYSGGTTINAGAIDAKVDDALGTGAVTVNDGGSLLLGTVGDDTGSVTLPNGINVAGDGNTGIGAINNAGGSNTLSGAISTTADTTIGSISGILAITNNITSTSNYDLTFTGEGDIGVQGVIGIGTGGVIKNGTGGLYLSGTNTYTGSTIINVGGIVTSSADALGACSDVTIADNATLVLDEDTTDVTLDNNIISVQGHGPGAYGAIVSTGDNNTISGSITQAGDTTIYSDNGNLTVSGAIGGAYGLTLDGAGDINISGAMATITGLAKDGDGTLTLSGANTYTGATAVNAGTLKAGIATQAFGAGSDVTVATGATLSLNNFNETIGSLSGSGTVNNSGAANRTLTVGSTPLGYGDGTSTTFSGLIADGGAGKFALTKDGTGTLVLSGANTYTGATIIDGGTLQAGNARALGTGAVTN